MRALAAEDATLQGTYWYDLRTRHPIGSRMKRVVDVAGALVAIALLSPLMLVIVAAIRLGGRGPVMFRQPRIGFRCNEFGMYKFRTMFPGAEHLEHELAIRAGAKYFKLPNDPRVTRVGRVLRRFSLDELPQLFNVLEGTMSLVGPRPLLLVDLNEIPERPLMRRFSVRPGMTGLWQVSGRNETTDEERMELDRRYINEWSLWLDMKILARTVVVVITGRGAM